jgi:hypothetical protein
MATIVPREQKIDMILMHRHGTVSELSRITADAFRRNVGRATVEPSPEALKAEAALKALPDADLETQYAEIKREAYREMRERAEAALPFNQPHSKADLGHWAKCAYWNLYEGVALILGKEPTVVNWESLRLYAKISPFVREFDRLVDLAERAVAANQLTKPAAPGTFIAWAKRYDIAVPPELEAAAAKYGHFIGDWKTLFDKTKKQLEEARARERAAGEMTLKLKADMDKLSTMIELAKAAQTVAGKHPKGVDVRELESLRKLAIGMAVAGYKYNPTDKRSDKIADIVGDLEKLAIPLDRDTVRKHLKAAAEVLPQDVLEKPTK